MLPRVPVKMMTQVQTKAGEQCSPSLLLQKNRQHISKARHFLSLDITYDCTTKLAVKINIKQNKHMRAYVASAEYTSMSSCKE